MSILHRRPLFALSRDEHEGSERNDVPPLRVAVLIIGALSRSLAAVLLALALPVVSAAADTTSQRPILVTLTAQSHQPRPGDSASWHWGYCVRVRTATGKSVASTIHLQILSGNTPVVGVGSVSLRGKGYDHWCTAIGGEGNVLDGVPRGKKLVFQAVVRAKGVTVKRDWLIIVR